MSKYRRTLTAPSRDSYEHLETLKPSVSISEPLLKIPIQERKKSVAAETMLKIPFHERKKSIAVNRGSSGSTSIHGIVGRYARRLSSKAQIKREDTQGSSLNLPSVSFRQEPTYKMEPDMKFSAKSVEEIIKDTLNRRLQDYKYDSEQTPSFGKILSADIKERVKRLNFDRYRIVCMLVIGENRGQCLQTSSRCQWYPSTDSFASYNYKNHSVFCSCTVYGIYAE